MLISFFFFTECAGRRRNGQGGRRGHNRVGREALQLPLRNREGVGLVSSTEKLRGDQIGICFDAAFIRPENRFVFYLFIYLYI